MNSYSSVPTLIAVITVFLAAVLGCASDTDKPNEVESNRVLKVVCYQAEGGSVFGLSAPGTNPGEVRINLFANKPAQAWFNGALIPEFDLSQTQALLIGILNESKADITVHVLDGANRADPLLAVISQTSIVAQDVNARFAVEYRVAVIDSEVPAL